MQYPDWTDEYGLYHTERYPSASQSENSPLFSAQTLTYKLLVNPNLKNEVKEEASKLLKVLDSEGFYNKYATAVVNANGWKHDDLSHDNFKGIYVLHYLAEKPIPFWMSKRSHIRPDNMILGLYMYLDSNIKFGESKSNLLKLLPLAVVSVLMLYPLASFINTSAKLYKTRKGQKFVVTDGKLLALMLLTTLGFTKIRNICTYFIRKNKYFTNWHSVSKMYFKNPDHPINRLLKEWDK